MTTETFTDIFSKKITQREHADKHPLDLTAKSRATDDAGNPTTKSDANWASLPAEQRSAATANINVYMNKFISVFQGGPRERCQMLRHLFHQIDWVFCPNEEAYINRKDPISLKELGQEDGA